MDIKIGVDIEEVKPIDFANVDITMSERQWKEIKSADEPLNTFYQYWTIKESIIKADGRGVNIPLDTLTWDDGISSKEGNKWHIQSLKVDSGYEAHLAISLPALEVSIEHIDFSNNRHLTLFQS